MRRRFRRLLAAAAAAAAVAVVAPLAGAAPQAPAAGGLAPAANPSSFRLADPDTVRAKDGRYVTYGTTVPAGRGKRCGGATGRLYVPVLVHGSGNTVGMTDCASGDALPGGPGAWAEPGGAIWAPGVARYGDRYFMFYTASRRDSGQKCIGRAVSGSARGPFRNAGEWACPPRGRWAIDANPFTGGGRLYVTYRDDAITAGAETGISTVRTDSAGRAVWSTRRDVLKSTDITWDTRRTGGGTHVVENPSMWRRANGTWYLMYSGNNWDSARYSTGIAECGGRPLPSSRCKPLRRGVERPYFGFTGSGGLGPYRGLPGNHRGPGGMDVFKAADGTFRVVWHWWDGGPRYPITGALRLNSGGYYVR
ncbi:family 43 glycosylhydrolase [Streptomyces sp. MAR4 CNX-425]|uniref:family 43 glycosylhydrolase n=1 Tax=Streptomyces sp. MAR4 CNX-425 TaxID=3406343 RepID=UPI003B511122